MADPQPGAAPLSNKQKTAAAIAAAVAVAAPLTASFEGLRTHPYGDPAPKHTQTVCYGETQVEMRVYSRDECGQFLRAHLAKTYAPIIYKCVPGFADHRAAFVGSLDASYNGGAGGFCRSPMARRFNADDWIGGANAFLTWHTLPGTAAHNGLVRRRYAERCVVVGNPVDFCLRKYR
jgi:lysozyme